MRIEWGKVALAAGALASAGAANAQEVVSTKPKYSLETQLSEQAKQIDAQNARIEELEAKLEEVTAILSNRVDKVEAASDSGKVINTNPGPRIEAINGRHSMNFIGAVQVGVGGVDVKSAGAGAPDVRGGTDIRRARIGVQGVAYNDFAYQAEIDIAANGTVSSAARDIWVQYNGFRPFALTVGNQKPQTGLEASFSDRSNAQTFIESSMLSSMYTSLSARGVGIRASTGGAHWSSSLGLFGDDVNNNGLASASTGEEGYGVYGRLTWAPVATPTSLLHLGVSGFDRKVSTDNTNTSQLRVRSQPESAIDAARLIDTGNLAFSENMRVLGVEAAAFKGPFGVQGEWGQMKVDRINGRLDPTFQGGYVGANWFVTGESRVYDPRTGVFTRVSPRKQVNASEGTWGAWEVAARWSTLDLDDHVNSFSGPTLLGVRGGEETNYTLAVNWYWNPYFRIMMNYVHADADNLSDALVPVDQSIEADFLGMRVQQEW